MEVAGGLSGAKDLLTDLVKGRIQAFSDITGTVLAGDKFKLDPQYNKIIESGKTA